MTRSNHGRALWGFLILATLGAVVLPRTLRSQIYTPPVQAGRIPISSLPFTINQCGSYFLTECLTGASGMNGITITTSDVTLDLNGFTITGVPGSLAGIATSGSQQNIRIKNGAVRGWGLAGIDLTASTNCLS